MTNPPAGVKLVMSAVCVMRDIKPEKINDPAGTGKKILDFWGPSKKLLGDMNFLNYLREYDKDNIPVSKKLLPFVLFCGSVLPKCHSFLFLVFSICPFPGFTSWHHDILSVYWHFRWLEISKTKPDLNCSAVVFQCNYLCSIFHQPRIMNVIRKEYVPNPDFDPQKVRTASSAAEGLCKWVCAMEIYDRVAKVRGLPRIFIRPVDQTPWWYWPLNKSGLSM